VPEPLRPLSFGQLIDAAGRLVWSAPRPLIGLAALPFAFFLPAAALDLPAIAQSGKPPDLEPLRAWMPQIVIGALVFVTLLSIVMTVVLAAQTYASAVARAERAPHVGLAWRVGWKHLWPLSTALLLLLLVPLVSVLPVLAIMALLSALSSPAMVASMILVVIVWSLLMFYAVARFSLLVPVVTLEGLTGVAALRRSWDLMEGQVARVVACFLVVGVSVTIVSTLIGAAVAATAIMQPSIGLWLGALLQLFFQGVGSALNSALLVAIYLDIRCRREAFDVVRLERALATVEGALQ
jgi:hypothetical protein